jgi:hypothetical protein
LKFNAKKEKRLRGSREICLKRTKIPHLGHFIIGGDKKRKKGIVRFAEKKLEGDVTISNVCRAILRAHMHRTMTCRN